MNKYYVYQFRLDVRRMPPIPMRPSEPIDASEVTQSIMMVTGFSTNPHLRGLRDLEMMAQCDVVVCGNELIKIRTHANLTEFMVDYLMARPGAAAPPQWHDEPPWSNKNRPNPVMSSQKWKRPVPPLPPLIEPLEPPESTYQKYNPVYTAPKTPTLAEKILKKVKKK